MPAAITPFDADGKIDLASMARLLASFRADGASGVVIAGTTGEGPSLSSFEKRDLVRSVVPLAAGLPVWIGVATTALEEAIWLAKEAGKAGAAGILLMPPLFYRNADFTDWFRAVLDRSPVDVLLYNFPRFAPEISIEVLSALASHPRMVGVKDSSGSVENLAAFAHALSGKRLYVGQELLLDQALDLGWRGTISGASNVLCRDLAMALADSGESRAVKLKLLEPALQEARQTPQPMGHKRVLKERGIIESDVVRLPLHQPVRV